MPLANPLTHWLTSNSSVPAGNTIADTSTPTLFASTHTIPAGWLVPGRSLDLELWGVYSAGIAQALVATIKAGSTALLTSPSLNGIANGTDLAWSARVSILCLTAGSSGTVDTQAALTFATAATAALSVNVGQPSPITLNTTISQVIGLEIDWGAAMANNSITLRQFKAR